MKLFEIIIYYAAHKNLILLFLFFYTMKVNWLPFDNLWGKMCFKYLVLCCTEVIYTLKIKDLYWHLIVCENKNRVCMCLNVYCVKFKGMDYPKNKNAIIYYRWCNAYYVEQKLKLTLCFVGFSIHWKSMGSNVIWLPVDNLWKEMCFKYHLLCCTEKSNHTHSLYWHLCFHKEHLHSWNLSIPQNVGKDSFENCSPNDSLGTQKWFFCGIAVEKNLWTLGFVFEKM